MKRAIRMNLMALLALSLFTACEKPNEKGEGSAETATKDYIEKAFGVNLAMVYVEGGEFEMGATAEQNGNAGINEVPIRMIKLDGYHIGKYEVTQAQWKALMGTTIAQQGDKEFDDLQLDGVGDNYPMYYVSWEEAQEFCNRLSKKTGKKYMLPTEAQWEYAARGGNKSQHYKYSGSNDIEEVAWYDDNSYGCNSVGAKKANELGIYDMSGNVGEWCSDWYMDWYDKADNYNPQGPRSGFSRVRRGGSWDSYIGYCRVSHRSYFIPGVRYYDLGFRVVCSSK